MNKWKNKRKNYGTEVTNPCDFESKSTFEIDYY